MVKLRGAVIGINTVHVYITLQNGESHMVNGYAEDLRQKLNYEPEPVPRQFQSQGQGSTVAITTNGDVIRTDNVSSQAGHSIHGRLLTCILVYLLFNIRMSLYFDPL